MMLQPSMLPAGKRGMLMREAAQPADADGSISGRTLVSASIDGWDEQHAFPSAKVQGCGFHRASKQTRLSCYLSCARCM